MGEVMLASTLGLEGAERPIIIKTIRSEHRTDASFKARFLDEARVQAQLMHPGVAQVIEATTDDESGESYVAVEYVEGRSLGDVRARALAMNAAIAWPEAVAILTQAAEALAHVHERVDAAGRPLSIVHRDLSPQNLMVAYGGDVKIIDFGTARGENRRCHTVAGVVFAKPGYVAPEVANGDSGDFRVDQYALGVMLWELCAGRRFLQGEASEHMASVAKNERNLPPIAAECGAPAALDAVIAALTAFDREERYRKTRSAARELGALLAVAPPLPGGERGVRARIASLMDRLFDGEAVRTRREFQRLVAQARHRVSTAKTPAQPSAQAARVVEDETTGLLPGTRYRVLTELGRGAKSVVHEAEHVDLGRRVAVKVLRAEFASSTEAEARIVREGRILSNLSIDGVVRALDVGQTSDGRPFSVLEKVEGRSLDHRLAEGGIAPWREAFELADRVLAVLEPLHRAGVVHRDLKPANVVVGDDGKVTLLDFGLALSRDELGATTGGAEPSQSRSVAVYGTPEYMAPEQVSRPDEVDGRADLYALGVMLYELVAGRLPFTQGSAVALLEAKLQGGPEPVPASAGLSEAAAKLVSRALARHPSLRFASANEMRVAVRSALSEPERRRTTRRRRLSVALVAALGCALGFGAWQLGAVRSVGARFGAEQASAPLESARSTEAGGASSDEVVVTVAAPALDSPAEPVRPAPEPERELRATAGNDGLLLSSSPAERASDEPTKEALDAAPALAALPTEAPGAGEPKATAQAVATEAPPPRETRATSRSRKLDERPASKPRRTADKKPERAGARASSKPKASEKKPAPPSAERKKKAKKRAER